SNIFPLSSDWVPRDVGEFTRGQMDRLVQQYNAVLQNIVADYKTKNYQGFAVIRQPPHLPFKTCPIQAVSSVDCFHPSTDAHVRIAAGLWNRSTLDAVNGPRGTIYLGGNPDFSLLGGT
ncbi:unnamed protein product, partial [Rhizoctonia solani]